MLDIKKELIEGKIERAQALQKAVLKPSN
jgi:hypothetical protein